MQKLMVEHNGQLIPIDISTLDLRCEKYINYQEWLLEKLQDPKLALAYLNEALTDKDPSVFFIALKNVLTAQGGDMSAIAQEAELNRQNLYRILSEKGDLRWDSAISLFNALGFQVQLLPKNKRY